MPKPSLIALIAALIAIAAYGLFMRPPMADSGDSPEFLTIAYNLRHYGIYKGKVDADRPMPQISREPGYSVFLAALMVVSPSFDHFTPSCLSAESLCDDTIYRPVQWTNAVLIGATGLILFFVAWLLTGSIPAGFMAEGYILLNYSMNKWRYYVMSDHLSLFLVSLTILLVLMAFRSKRPSLAALAGLAAAALTLTKAVFLLFIVPALALLALIALLPKNRSALPLLCIAALVYALPLMTWAARNEAVSGSFRLTDMRGGIALSTREVFVHMSVPQYFAAFVYWTPGFGPLWPGIYSPRIL